MKSPSTAYQAKEEAVNRKPLEVYHLWTKNGLHWRYTSADEAITFDGHTYNPAAIRRESVTYDSDLSASSVQVAFGRVTGPLVDYITQNPVEVVWIQVSRLFSDQEPREAGVIFIGQVSGVSIRGAQATATCVGFEFYLKQPIPQRRYQRQCNWTLFDSRCAKSSFGFTVTTTVTVSDDGLRLTSADFSAASDGHYEWGKVVFGAYQRMVIKHSGSDIWIRYPIPDMVSESAITAYAGCDGSIETCRDKFDNVANFGGFPYIPLDNPALWR